MTRFFGEEIASFLRSRYPGTCTHLTTLPARPARYGNWPEWAVVRDVDKLYEHQAIAADLAFHGTHVVLATGTSSGKSLAYQLPILSTLLTDPKACALYITPTKALGSDQLRAIRHDVQAAPYDGDTPADARRHIRDQARWIFTNPDMLHASMLQNHQRWARFFRQLRFVVVDECHSYRGVFGAHVALVLRRLRRVAALYGSEPTFFFASATSADPAGHAQRLSGLPVQAVTDDAAPTGARTIMLWEPDFMEGVEGENGAPVRRPASVDAATLMAGTIAEGARTLGFVRSRRQAETVALRCAEELALLGLPDFARRVAPYRAGYLAEDRRRLERMLDDGSLLGVSATNALELGIDVGGLDAVIIAGYPGTIASFWQQAGRAGRRGQGSLVVLVARDDPMDMFLVHHPEALLGVPLENHVFNPENPVVLRAHIHAAAREQPLSSADIADFGAQQVVEELEQARLLRRRSTRTGDRWFALGDPLPVSLRGSGTEVAIVDGTDGRFLGTIDSARAHSQVHPGAVYLHQGESFVIDSLEDDLALAHPEEPEWNTFARSVTSINVIGELPQEWVAAVDVDVTDRTVGYIRKLPDGTVIDMVPLDLPPQTLVTRAVMITLDASLLPSGISDLPGALHAAEHAMIGLLPLVATCDRWDLGGVSTALHEDTGQPTIFIYDAHPGGAGFSDHGFAHFRTWVSATVETLRSCPCEAGCPSCVQSPKCGNGNEPLDKAGATLLLDAMLGAAQAD